MIKFIYYLFFLRIFLIIKRNFLVIIFFKKITVKISFLINEYAGKMISSTPDTAEGMLRNTKKQMPNLLTGHLFFLYYILYIKKRF